MAYAAYWIVYHLISLPFILFTRFSVWGGGGGGGGKIPWPTQLTGWIGGKLRALEACTYARKPAKDSIQKDSLSLNFFTLHFVYKIF